MSEKNKKSAKDIKTTWTKTKPTETKAPVESKETSFPTLTFKQSGWCEALGHGYRKGVYAPKSKQEFDALKEFAE